MARPQRKPAPLSHHGLDPERAAHDNENNEDKDLAREEARFSEQLEHDLKTDPYLEVHRSDIRAWRAFRRAFNLHHIDLNGKEIIVYNAERDVAITRAFNLKDSEHLTFVTKSRAEARMLEVKGGLQATKGDAEWHEFDKQGFIVVAMNDDTRVTRHLLKNVEPGGWFLCGIHVGNALRGTGKYELKGVIERNGASPTVNKSVGEDFWEKIEARSDDEYQKAGKVEGMVTREEMEAALGEAGRKTGGDVTRSYVQLLEDAKAQGNELTIDGDIVYKTRLEEVETTVTLNPVLPTKLNEHANDIVVMKRFESI